MVRWRAVLVLALLAAYFSAGVETAVAASFNPASLTILAPGHGQARTPFTADAIYQVSCAPATAPPPPLDVWFYWGAVKGQHASGTLLGAYRMSCNAKFLFELVQSIVPPTNVPGIYTLDADFYNAGVKPAAYLNFAQVDYTIDAPPTPTSSTPTPTATPTRRPTATPTAIARATPTPPATPTPTPSPSPSPSPSETLTPGPVAGVGTPTPSGGSTSTPSRPLGFLTPPTLAAEALCFLIPLALLWFGFMMFGGAGAAVAGAAAGPSVLPSDPPMIEDAPPPTQDPPVESPP